MQVLFKNDKITISITEKKEVIEVSIHTGGIKEEEFQPF
jgi:hypothetical protein